MDSFETSICRNDIAYTMSFFRSCPAMKPSDFNHMRLNYAKEKMTTKRYLPVNQLRNALSMENAAEIGTVAVADKRSCSEQQTTA